MNVDRDLVLDVSHRLHANPETAFQEHASAELVASVLEQRGFSVERGVADIPTAFRATYGTGELNIAICAEYDALPGVGHACGHNIIAAAAVGAAVALAPRADELGLTVTVMGTPAEEGGGGKIFMLQRGVFDGVCAALMVHPGALERDGMASLATSQMQVEYFGLAAHAAAAPERGKSASAALALAQSGIAMLREHFAGTDRVHGIVTNGGDAPNVVPQHTSGRWFVRSDTVERKNALQERVIDIFKGAALMTGCRMEVRKTSPGYTEIISDEAMTSIWRAKAGEVGRQSLPHTNADGVAATDMGNVSYAVPTIHPLLALDSNGANIHEPAFEQCAGNKTGDDAAVDGARVMAETITAIAEDPQLRSRLIRGRYEVASTEENAAYLDRDWNTPTSFGSHV